MTNQLCISNSYKIIANCVWGIWRVVTIGPLMWINVPFHIHCTCLKVNPLNSVQMDTTGSRVGWPRQGLMLQKRWSRCPPKMSSHHDPLVRGLRKVRILCCWPTPQDREQDPQAPHSVHEQFLVVQSAPTHTSSPSGNVYHKRPELDIRVK